MTKQREKTRSLVEMALFAAIIVILTITPLGFIPLGFMSATTIHIPVIIAGIVFGWKKGALTGFMFGLASLIKATFQPNISSFVFSPFIPNGNGFSLLICFLPRILIGIVACLVYTNLVKIIKKKTPALFIAGIAGSMTNTIFVLGMAYIFFAEKFVETLKPGIGEEGANIALKTIAGAMVTNGIPEAIVAGIISSAVCAALMAAYKNRLQ